MIKSNMRVIWVLILTVLFAVTLSACGSGGSGGNYESNAGGEVTSLFDASLFDEEDDLLACKRPDHEKVPVAGEHCCTTSGQELCWKTGPIREDTKNFFFNSDEIPTYFELTKDYEIPVAAYFADPPPVSFPNFARVVGDGDPDTKRERLAPLLFDLPMHFSSKVEKLVNTRKWDFLRYSGGNLIIKKGYRWDGASVGWDRKYFDDRLLRTYLVNMRSSLVHDAFYDLIRFCALPCDTTGKAPRKGGKEDYRDLADTLFYLTAKEDGHDDGLKVFYKTLRRLGQTKARLHAEKDAAWRFHTQASASVSAGGVDMVIDDEGNKSFTMMCAEGSNTIVLDTIGSHPIAERPGEGEYQENLHETTWEWSLNSAQLVPMNKNTIDAYIDWNALRTTLTLDELTAKGLVSGVPNIITLHTDKGKDTSKGFFESEDGVEIRVEFDTEPPVISGISEPIIVWPPNHKYKPFTIGDFVSSVSDNCMTMSLDDLVISQVTGDEPDDDKGDGHTNNDNVISPDRKSVDLRIERQGKDNGRVYTIFIEAVDGSGNTATESFEVHVPHNN
jgi:hypothetical protein